MADEGRNLTNEDVKAIVTLLKAEIVSEFYGDVGRGVWELAKKALVWVVLVLAVMGLMHNTKFISTIAAQIGLPK